jgi:hypothetical protein
MHRSGTVSYLHCRHGCREAYELVDCSPLATAVPRIVLVH